MYSLHSKVGKDKEALEVDYQKALEHIFAYSYGCCALKHGICGDLPGIPNGMPDSIDPLSPKFFVNPGCPSALKAVEAKAVEEHMGEAAKDPVEDVIVEEHG